MGKEKAISFCSLLLVWVWLRVTELSHHALQMEMGCAFGICAQGVITRDLIFHKNIPESFYSVSTLTKKEAGTLRTEGLFGCLF